MGESCPQQLTVASPETLSQSVQLLRKSRDCIHNPLSVSVLQSASAALCELIWVPQSLLAPQKLPENTRVRSVHAMQDDGDHLLYRAAGRGPGNVFVSQDAAGRGLEEDVITALLIAPLPPLLGLVFFTRSAFQVLPVLLLQPGVQLSTLPLLLLLVFFLVFSTPLPVCLRSGMLLGYVLPPDSLGPVREVSFIFIISQEIWKTQQECGFFFFLLKGELLCENQFLVFLRHLDESPV